MGEIQNIIEKLHIRPGKFMRSIKYGKAISVPHETSGGGTDDSQKFKLFTVKYLGSYQWEYPNPEDIVSAWEAGYIPMLTRLLSEGYPQYFMCAMKGGVGTPWGANSFYFVNHTQNIELRKTNGEWEWLVPSMPSYVQMERVSALPEHPTPGILYLVNNSEVYLGSIKLSG